MSRSCNSLVGTAAVHGPDHPGFHSRQGQGIFLLQNRPDGLWSLAKSPIQWVVVTISQGVTRPGREDGQSHLSNAEVKE